MTDREAWSLIKPILKPHIEGDRELSRAYVRTAQALERQERETIEDRRSFLASMEREVRKNESAVRKNESAV